jgi:hypothetical protein
MCGGGNGMLGGSPPGPGGPMFGGGKGMFGGMLGAVCISSESVTCSQTYVLHGPRTAAGVDRPAFLALAAYHLAFLDRVSIAFPQAFRSKYLAVGNRAVERPFLQAADRSHPLDSRSSGSPGPRHCKHP